jgi:hypothetical protein
MKTDREIVDGCNALARKFYAGMGYDVPEGYRFDQAHHPQEMAVWDMAVTAYEHVDGTDVEDALTAIEDEEESRPRRGAARPAGRGKVRP